MTRQTKQLKEEFIHNQDPALIASITESLIMAHSKTITKARVLIQ